MEREDGTEILRGTAAIGGNNPPSALEQRISELRPPETPVILRDVRLGMRTKRIAVRMDADQHMGALYPFSLAAEAAGDHRAFALVHGRGRDELAVEARDHSRSRW